MRILRVAAVAEAATLVLLLVNLATAHVPAVAAALGPVHGTAYLAVIVATCLERSASPPTRWWAALPGLGGLLAVRRLRDATPSSPSRTDEPH